MAALKFFLVVLWVIVCIHIHMAGYNHSIAFRSEEDWSLIVNTHNAWRYIPTVSSRLDTRPDRYGFTTVASTIYPKSELYDTPLALLSCRSGKYFFQPAQSGLRRNVFIVMLLLLS